MGIINVFPLLGCTLYQSVTGLLFDLFGEGTNVLHRSVGSYRIYFLFLTSSIITAILFTFKVVKTLNKDYKGKV